VQSHAARQSIWAAVSKIAELRDVLNMDEGVHARFDHVARVMGLTSQWSPGVRESHICPEAVQLPKRATKAVNTQAAAPKAATKSDTKTAKKAASKAGKKAAKATKATKKRATKSGKKAVQKTSVAKTAQAAKKST